MLSRFEKMICVTLGLTPAAFAAHKTAKARMAAARQEDEGQINRAICTQLGIDVTNPEDCERLIDAGIEVAYSSLKSSDPERRREGAKMALDIVELMGGR